MAIISLSARDGRIGEVCRQALPRTPRVAEYLTRRLEALGGSERVANLILARLPTGAHVDSEVITRLCVDNDLDAMKRLMDWYGDTLDTSMTALSLQLHASLGGVASDRITEFIRVYVCTRSMLSGVEFDPRAIAA